MSLWVSGAENEFGTVHCLDLGEEGFPPRSFLGYGCGPHGARELAEAGRGESGSYRRGWLGLAALFLFRDMRLNMWQLSKMFGVVNMHGILDVSEAHSRELLLWGISRTSPNESFQISASIIFMHQSSD